MSDPRDVSVYHLLFKMVSSLVDHPEDVIIQTLLTNEGVTFTIRVHPEDVQKLIGEQARNIQSLRNIVDGAGLKLDRRFTLLIETEPPEPADPRD
jgi:predicted RNA-binding protein YlqC (UPF0109 family)